MPSVVSRLPIAFTSLPEEATYVLANCSVPAACLNSLTEHDSENPDRLVRCDIMVSNGIITEIGSLCERGIAHPTTDLEGGLCFPTFVDLHTHIGAKQATYHYRVLLLPELVFYRHQGLILNQPRQQMQTKATLAREAATPRAA